MAYFCRRSYSLDVEVSASGFTKEMEKDGALLHPAGPDEENVDEEESDDDEEEAEEEGENEEESLDMEEYRHAMQELEGLKFSDTHVDTHTKDKEDKATEKEPETRLESTVGGDEETEKDLKEEELLEAEEECPELADLSTCNKEFKPFR